LLVALLAPDAYPLRDHPQQRHDGRDVSCRLQYAYGFTSFRKKVRKRTRLAGTAMSDYLISLYHMLAHLYILQTVCCVLFALSPRSRSVRQNRANLAQIDDYAKSVGLETPDYSAFGSS
jgi:hypothetical protein